MRGNHKIWGQKAPGTTQGSDLEQPLGLFGSQFPHLNNEG